LKSLLVLLLLLVLPLSSELSAQRKTPAERAYDVDQYDPIFRKYTKRFFGVGFDWQYFKAQGLAESDMIPTARSRVGARGIMQLMPGTYNLIKKNRREAMGAIDDPEWNIAAGILHDRSLWHRWENHPTTDERLRFMFASYNAGEGVILRAKKAAAADKLDERRWKSIESVAPKVERWRYKETLPYVQKIEANHRKLVEKPHRVNAMKRTP
jgi:soluble lytic murein transglycosylase-like protein